MTSTQKGGEEASKFVACLRILLFLNNGSINLLFIFANEKGGIHKLVIFCGCHNCMITNIKKVMILVIPLAPVVQWNSYPHFLVYLFSKGKVNIFIFKNCTKTRSCKSLFKQILPWEKKTKNLPERPHLLSGLFIKVFYKTTTCPRLPLLSVPKSGRLIVLYRFDCIKFIIFLKDLVAFINYLSVSTNDFMYCYFSFVHMLLLILCYNYFIMS